MKKQIILLKTKLDELFENKSKEFIDFYIDFVWFFDEYFKNQATEYIKNLENYPGISLEKTEFNMDDLEKKLSEIYLLGMTEWLAENNSELLKVWVWEKLELLSNEFEVNYAKENAGRLIQQIDSTTQKDIWAIISKWIEESLSIWAIATNIQEKFSSYSLYRATLITNQEVSQAYEFWKKQNFENNKSSLWVVWWKRSITQWDDGVRPSHLQNEMDGWIPADRVFSWTGTDIAPHWIWCRCYIQYSLVNPETGKLYDDTLYQYDEPQFIKFNDNWGSLEDIWIKLSQKELDIQKAYNLLPEEVHVIKGYTGTSSISFKDWYKFWEWNEMFQSWIPFLFWGLNKLPRYEKNVFSWYKVQNKSDYKYFANLKVWKSFYFDDFISSSKKKSIAEDFMSEDYKLLFQIKSKKGIDVSLFSINPLEEEVIFLPKNLFVVEKIEFSDNILQITLSDL